VRRRASVSRSGGERRAAGSGGGVGRGAARGARGGSPVGVSVRFRRFGRGRGVFVRSPGGMPVDVLPALARPVRLERAVRDRLGARRRACVHAQPHRLRLVVQPCARPARASPRVRPPSLPMRTPCTPLLPPPLRKLTRRAARCGAAKRRVGRGTHVARQGVEYQNVASAEVGGRPGHCAQKLSAVHHQLPIPRGDHLPAPRQRHARARAAQSPPAPTGRRA
jgi:hypothetical protein